jgi:predicted lipoprotein with Yx(FWY)xxD motif
MKPNRVHIPIRLFSLAGVITVLSLLLAACQPAATPTLAPTDVPATVAPTATAAPTDTIAPAVTEPTLMVATDAKLGKILVDDKGMTLYMYTKDTADTSNCAAGCLANWPPLLTAGSPKAGDGVDAKMIGSATLADGRKIVTYNHMPLYYWVKDAKAGDTTGQNVGKVWFVVNPDGTVVKPAAEATIKVADDPKLGKILVDDKGMTLYMYTKDTADTSTCNAGCLANWPPLLTSGSPVAGDGVDASKLGSTATTDGRKIVTYNHMPLYYWAKDTKAGDTTGQNVGKVWFVVNPDGTAVMPVMGTLNVATDANLGKILVDSKGMTLYMYTKDTADTSTCNAGCLANWPPLIADGTPTVGDGVDASMIGSTTTTDGRKIVTYNHMPLYYWAKDTKAGDTTGQNVGKVWFVVGPDGKPNMTVPAASTSQGASTEPTINVATDAKLGKILVDGKGMTLYLYKKDTPGVSNCSGDCLAAWPPLLTKGKPNLGAGVDATKIATAKLADGSLIVTYAGMPLYYFAKDTKAGDTTGQGAGSVWYVVAP